MKKLNFGCGEDCKSGWDNVDIQKGPNIISFNFDNWPYPLKKNYYDYILINNVLEHLKSPDAVLTELWKHCKSEAVIEIIVPYYQNKGAYTDMTHLHYFSDSSFYNFVEKTCQINKKKLFEIQELTLSPTKIGKLIPKKLREVISLFIGGLIADINVKLIAKK